MNKITKKEVYLFLKQSKSAVISSVNLEGKPESALIYYGVDKDLNFYFVTGDRTRKYANLKRNPKASLVVSDEYRLITLQTEGKAEEIYSVKKNSVSVKLLTEVMTPSIKQTLAHIWDPIPPILKMKNGKISIFKFTPEWMRWSDFNPAPNEVDGQYYKLIIP